MERKKIGDYFVEKGVLKEKDKLHILKVAHETGRSFGETGLHLGLITREDMVGIFGPRFEIDFFYLDPRYFPAVTRDALSLEEILKLGALPLGLKKKEGFLSRRKVLNMGFLDPGNQKSVQEAQSLALRKLSPLNVTELKVYLILADQFLEVLRENFGFDFKLHSPAFREIDEVLSFYLDR